MARGRNRLRYQDGNGKYVLPQANRLLKPRIFLLPDVYILSMSDKTDNSPASFVRKIGRAWLILEEFVSLFLFG